MNARGIQAYGEIVKGLSRQLGLGWSYTTSVWEIQSGYYAGKPHIEVWDDGNNMRSVSDPTEIVDALMRDIRTFVQSTAAASA